MPSLDDLLTAAVDGVGGATRPGQVEMAHAVEQAIGLRPPLPPHMARLMDLPERVTRVENDNAALKSLILERRTA